MSEELSSIISPASLKTKIQQATSFILISVGLGLMSWGGWLFYQQQVEASQPPPAPIVDSAAIFAAIDRPQETLSPTPKPGSTPVSEMKIDPNPRPSANSREATPVSTAKVQTSAATKAHTLSPSRSKAETQPITDTANSLEGNPLIVALSDLSAIMDLEPNFSNLPVQRVDSPLTRLVAESIDLDTPVVGIGWTEVIQNGQPIRVWTVANRAAGWHQNSKLPGEGGNIVLSGHHNIKGEVFRYIVDLEIGDSLTLYMGDQLLTYTVSDKFIVKDKGEPEEVRLANARWIGPFEDERLTLVTCWPYTNNTHRVIVIARPADGSPVDDQALESSPVNETTLQPDE